MPPVLSILRVGHFVTILNKMALMGGNRNVKGRNLWLKHFFFFLVTFFFGYFFFFFLSGSCEKGKGHFQIWFNNKWQKAIRVVNCDSSLLLFFFSILEGRILSQILSCYNNHSYYYYFFSLILIVSYNPLLDHYLKPWIRQSSKGMHSDN